MDPLKLLSLKLRILTLPLSGAGVASVSSYRISFQGLITSAPTTSEGQNQDLTGLMVSGFMEDDLSIAPGNLGKFRRSAGVKGRLNELRERQDGSTPQS